MASTQLPPGRAARAKNNTKLVHYDEYIDTQIRSTRRMVKVVEFSTALVLIATGALAFLLVAAAVEHWLMPGGFSMPERFALFAVLAGCVGYFAYRRLWPLCVRAINPVYAAQTIEQSSPSLKNSLVNLLLFRQRRADISDAVYETLEEQAAKQLTHVPVDAAVDRTHLIRLGYVLVAVAGLAGLYKVFSPKDPLVAAERVLMPWADIVPASRVVITDVTPGAVTIALGEFVDVSAEVRGISESDPVVLRYTTVDGQAMNKSISMVPTDGGLRFKCRLPDAAGGSPAAGVSQNLCYHLEAGDARSHEFAVKVVAAPSILVKRVEYEYPKYTGYVNRSVDDLGDLRGIEGTRVTIHAAANGPIEEAYVDFDADGRRDTKMTVDGSDATASFTLALREDRQTAEHVSYVLRFMNQEGRTNRDPVKYPIEVRPDYEPEVRILAPQEKVFDVRLNDTVAIEVEASDPDFALGEVRLHGEVAGRGVLDKQLLAQEHKGKFTGRFAFKPSEHNLHAGDVLQYWATAADNRTPQAGSTSTERKLIRVGSVDPAQQPQPDRIAQRDQPRQQPGEPQPRDGQRGEKQQQRDGQKGDRQQGVAKQSDGKNEQGGQPNQDDARQNAREQERQGEGEQQPQNQQQQPRDQQNQNGESSGDKGGQPQEKPQQGDQQGDSQGQQNGESKPGQRPQDKQNGKPGSANQKNDQGTKGGSEKPEGAGVEDDPARAPSKQQPGANQGAGRDSKPSDQVGNEGDASQPSNEGGKQGQQSKPGDPKSQGQQGNVKDGGSESASKGARPDGAQPKGGKSTPPKGNERNAPEPQSSPVSSDGDNDGEAFQRIQRHMESKGEIKKDEPPPKSEGQTQPPGEDSQQGNDGKAKNKQQDGKGDKSAAKQQTGDRGKSDGNAPPEAGKGQPNAQGDKDGSKSNNKTQDKQKPDQPGMSEKDQGDGPGAETRPGDPQQPVDKKQPDEGNEHSKSPGGQQMASKGPAGDGQQPSETEGAPDPGRQAKPRQKWEQDKSPDKLKDDKEPAMPSRGKEESSSKGNQGGDQTGGGQEGGGQKSPHDGTGSSGQNQSADAGAGESSERGTGNKSADGGQDAPADHRTGQPGSNQPGEGSSQRDGQGNKPGGESKSDSANKEAGKNSPQGSGEQKPGAQEQPEQSSAPSGKNEQQGAKGGGKKPDAADAKEQPGAGKQDKGESGTNGTGAPTGGGATGAGAGQPTPVNGEAPAGDAANLEYARKQTDLVLEKLAEQLKRKQVDNELLKELGWTEEEVRTFVARWQKLKQAAGAKNPSAEAARRELDESLRSLGLRRGPLQQAKVKDDDARNMREGYHGTVPP